MRNPIKSFIEMFLPEDTSPLKNVPVNHPDKQYSYTLVGYNEQPLSSESLLQLGFLGQVKNSRDYVILNHEMLWKDLNTVVGIAKLFNIHKIRKYRTSGEGIEWESTTDYVYKALISARLFEV